MRSDQAMYRERTPWPWWVNALVYGGFVAAALPILAGWGGTERPMPHRLLLATGLLLGAVLIQVIAGGTTVLVQRRGIHVFLGTVPVFSKRVAYSDIRWIESVRYRPIKEFGGWGLRGFGAKQAWTARGDRALVLHLLDGRDIYLGSDHPDRLAQRVRMAAGEHIGVKD